MLKSEAIQALLDAGFNTRTNGEVVTIFTGTDQSEIAGEMTVSSDNVIEEFWAYPGFEKEIGDAFEEVMA